MKSFSAAPLLLCVAIHADLPLGPTGGNAEQLIERPWWDNDREQAQSPQGNPQQHAQGFPGMYGRPPMPPMMGMVPGVYRGGYGSFGRGYGPRWLEATDVHVEEYNGPDYDLLAGNFDEQVRKMLSEPPISSEEGDLQESSASWDSVDDDDPAAAAEDEKLAAEARMLLAGQGSFAGRGV